MADLNYAELYTQALEQAYPYVLHFGALYSTPNNGRFRWTGAKTIEIPSITVSGMKDGSRDSISTMGRHYDNSWEPKTLTRHRYWDTLVHPMDIDQTNMVASIQNITRVFNDEQKFPEQDAYTVSKIYADWTELGYTATELDLTVENVLTQFDADMQAMTEARVPTAGRVLYVTPAVYTLLKNAESITRNFDVQNTNAVINRMVNSLDQVQIEQVPPELMKTAYDFTEGWEVGSSAKQIHMFLVHPNSVITPVTYESVQIDPPSAITQNKYYYYEESFMDVFILNKKADGIRFTIEASSEE